MTIFKNLHNSLDGIINQVAPNLITHFMGDLKPVASAGLGLYFLWLLIPLAMGNSKHTAHDVFMKLIVWSIVWTFAFNSEVLHAANAVVNEIYHWAAGTQTIYTKLDASYDDIVAVAKKLEEADDNMVLKIKGFFAEVMVLGSYYVFAFVSIAFLVVSKMILNLLILALPLTILAILFPMIKNMFANWVHLFIDNILTVLFLNIIFTIVNDKLTVFITKALSIAKSPNPANLLSFAGEIAFTITLMLLFVVMSRIMASKLASAAMSSEAMNAIPKVK